MEGASIAGRMTVAIDRIDGGVNGLAAGEDALASSRARIRGVEIEG